MNVMEVSSSRTLEAFVFNYVSFDLFNLWTWLAVLTAIISLWKLRASSSSAVAGTAASLSLPSPSPPRADNLQPDKSPSPSSLSQATSPLPPSPSPSSLVMSVSDSNARFEDEGIMKAKFVSYYYGEDGDNVSDVNCGGDGQDGDGDVTVTVTVTELWGSWEKLRMGEMGWYRHQDLTVINGNVVRLWDDVSRRKRNYKEGEFNKLSFNYCCCCCCCWVH